MSFVQRDDNGKINGVYAFLCKGVAEEELPDDNPEVLSFQNPPPPPVEIVSARQFKLQLLASGLLDQVDAWIASQSKAVQIAYEYSGTFVKSEPMLQAGFNALGFTDEQLDGFFQAASKI
ncbi:hypothetical protein IB244_31215 [Rhizobium sp. RHZ02]|uniref:hypothetical protein n=1 Tax=Rhizobium sp. RHZ02 TaxID=2769306 RepID=UPI001782F735|nr:hypothetical protein [Rhizobium sp. RHZ02]MBD9455942.1 hypothetical protein [Rhizobium sp. RHZ02]